MPILNIQNLSFSYRNASILKQLCLSLNKGDIATLIGTSGSGKTTLFKLLTGMLSNYHGHIEVDGSSLPTGCKNIAYMMQEHLLLPWRTIFSNMMLLTELGKNQQSNQSLHKEARRLLKEIGMTECENMLPEQLSGGMRQRISLAQALLQQRSLLLLDEPFSSLDVILREQMYSLLRDIQAKYKTTILMVTHDFRDALSLSNKIFLLKDGSIQREWQIPPDSRSDPYLTTTLLNEMRESMQKPLTEPSL